MKNSDLDLLLMDEALNAIARETGQRMVFNDQPAPTLRLTPDSGDVFRIVTKRWAQHADFGALLAQLLSVEQPVILIADYVNTNLGRRLRDAGIAYLDTVGNAFVHASRVFLCIDGRKYRQALELREETNRAFEPTGLKIIFALLCQPSLVNASYRQIAIQSGVSLGAVQWVINGLKQEAFVAEGKAGRVLLNGSRLLMRWAELIPGRLKPKYHVGYFSVSPDVWQALPEIEHFGARWSGEVAADLFTGYLRPSVATLYIPATAGHSWMASMQIKKKLQQDDRLDEHVLRVYRSFWTEDLQTLWTEFPRTCVHPVLVYADLIALGDARNIETARRLYEQHLSGSLGQAEF